MNDHAHWIQQEINVENKGMTSLKKQASNDFHYTGILFYPSQLLHSLSHQCNTKYPKPLANASNILLTTVTYIIKSGTIQQLNLSVFRSQSIYQPPL